MSSTHTVPLKIYFGVFIALCVLTGVTVWTAKHDYGALNTPVALAIAGLKASLVILFFMHVKYSSKLTQLFAFAGFFWLVLLLVFTLQDFMTRGMLPTYVFKH
ncbi:MAG: cytochrome C oxidase subunit IV family protein [Planctomycetes bacterium]|jgi:cytochrome c oxidase subunit 4|nr:cytochrome C oxidase subunit IV family protein [Planctomycetota bacterium]